MEVEVRGLGSSCWSTWAHWMAAGRRDAEARRSQEGKAERAETQGRSPCCRPAGN